MSFLFVCLYFIGRVLCQGTVGVVGECGGGGGRGGHQKPQEPFYLGLDFHLQQYQPFV